MSMRVLIVRNSERRKAAEASYALGAYLSAEGCAYEVIESSQIIGIDQRRALRSQLTEPLDLVVVLGGDGTIIRTASLIGSAAPLLGINFGHLGFLANASEEGVVDLVSRAFCGELDTSSRTCLDVRFYDDADEEVADCFAVNEIAITRGVSGTSLEFGFEVSGVSMAALKGDGLIVATATGSTGYSLAAGGPLVTPGFRGMVVQPLAPHTLLSRALLTDANDVVEVTLTRPEDSEAAVFLIDGDVVPLSVPIASVRVQRASESVTFLYAGPDHFLSYSAEKFFEA